MPRREFARGLGASLGEARGRVVVVNTVEEIGKVQHGDIMVVPTSTPAWTIGMLKASAIVSEFGGLISHCAIVAREMGVPCVVAVPDATKRFEDGMEVTVKVESDEGVIYEN